MQHATCIIQIMPHLATGGQAPAAHRPRLSGREPTRDDRSNKFECSPPPRTSPDPVSSYMHIVAEISRCLLGGHICVRVYMCPLPIVLVTLRLASQNALADAMLSGPWARRMIARAVPPTVLSTQYSAHLSRLWHSYARGSNPTGLQQLSPDHDRLVMS